jgi:hypothetical protein
MSLSSGHRRIDERSLVMHRAIADKLRAEPALLGIAHENLERWYETAGHSRPYLDEWRRILTLPLEEVLAALARDDERMTALRQSSPFAGVLAPDERWGIYAQFERKSEEAAQ